jgi:hypothetical protein
MQRPRSHSSAGVISIVKFEVHGIQKGHFGSETGCSRNCMGEEAKGRNLNALALALYHLRQLYTTFGLGAARLGRPLESTGRFIGNALITLLATTCWGHPARLPLECGQIDQVETRRAKERQYRAN